MEEKNNEKHPHPHRKRRRPGGSGNSVNNSSNTVNNGSGSPEPRNHGNGSADSRNRGGSGDSRNHGSGPADSRNRSGSGDPKNHGNGPAESRNSGSGSGESRNHSNGGYTKANQNPQSQTRQRKQNNSHSHNQHNNNNNSNNSSNKKQGGQNNRPRKKGYQPDTGKDAIRSFILGTWEDEGMYFVFSFDKGTYRIEKGKIPVMPEGVSEDSGDPNDSIASAVIAIAGEIEAGHDITAEIEAPVQMSVSAGNVPGQGNADEEEISLIPKSIPVPTKFPPRKEDFFDRETAEELLMTRDKVLAYQTWNDIKRPKKGKPAKTEARSEE